MGYAGWRMQRLLFSITFTGLFAMALFITRGDAQPNTIKQIAAGGRVREGDLKESAPEAPKEMFTKTPHIIEDSTRRVELRYFGWAHTRGDGFLYLPKEKVLCTGDAAVNGPYNFVADGNIGNWPNVIAKAQ